MSRRTVHRPAVDRPRSTNPSLHGAVAVPGPRRFGFCLLLLISTLASAASAQESPRPERTFRLDTAATEVRFSLGATLHTVRGTARAHEGVVRFDEAAQRAEGSIRIDARSLESGNDGRDKAMHEDVLESERYPEIVFVTESYEGALPTQGAGKITLRGRLEIHGGSHPMALPLELTVRDGAVSGQGGFRVPFVAWGMKDPSKLMLRVDKEVVIELAVRGRLEASSEQGTAEADPS